MVRASDIGNFEDPMEPGLRANMPHALAQTLPFAVSHSLTKAIGLHYRSRRAVRWNLMMRWLTIATSPAEPARSCPLSTSPPRVLSPVGEHSPLLRRLLLEGSSPSNASAGRRTSSRLAARPWARIRWALGPSFSFGVCAVGICPCAPYARSGKPLEPEHHQERSILEGAKEPPKPIDAQGARCPSPPSVGEQPYEGRPEGDRE
jgi:hypothetical protein